MSAERVRLSKPENRYLSTEAAVRHGPHGNGAFETILNLQRTAGNRAVGSILAVQRDEEDVGQPGSRPNLDVGDTGPGVKLLQRKLTALGAHLDPDGKFGRGTHRAAVKFQRQRPELHPATGGVGPGTWAALDAEAPDAGGSFSEIRPSDITIPPDIPVPDTRPKPSPSATQFALQFIGSAGGGEGVVGEAYSFDILDLENHLRQSFHYFGGGAGAGTPVSFTPFPGDPAPFSTPKRASLGNFAGPAQIFSAGVGPFSWASLILDSLGSGPDGPIGSLRIPFNSTTTLGAGLDATSGFFIPQGSPQPE